MKTEAEVKSKLNCLKAEHKQALEARMIWTISDTRHEIDMLEWVLA